MRPILVLAYFSLISLELSSPEEFQDQPVPNNVATLRSKSNIPAALQNKITTTVSPSELFFKVVTTTKATSPKPTQVKHVPKGKSAPKKTVSPHKIQPKINKKRGPNHADATRKKPSPQKSANGKGFQGNTDLSLMPNQTDHVAAGSTPINGSIVLGPKGKPMTYVSEGNQMAANSTADIPSAYP